MCQLIFIQPLFKMDVLTHYWISCNIESLSIIDVQDVSDLDIWNNCPCQLSACINDSLLKIDIVTQCSIRLCNMAFWIQSEIVFPRRARREWSSFWAVYLCKPGSRRQKKALSKYVDLGVIQWNASKSCLKPLLLLYYAVYDKITCFLHCHPLANTIIRTKFLKLEVEMRFLLHF